jgi:hypothetical protein
LNVGTSSSSPAVVLPDAGPLITLAYADALEQLLKPGWPVRIVDAALHKVTRNATPTSEKIGRWAQANRLAIVSTRAFQHYQAAQIEGSEKLRKAHLGELAIQEAMHDMALAEPEHVGIFLFEDHKIARASFLVPDNCRKISTRAWLQFLEGKGWIDSAADVERAAIAGGRNISRLRFPP